MGDIFVDVAGMKFSCNPKEILHARSLGCCIGLSFYDDSVKCGGIVICVLPNSGTEMGPSAEDRPVMFADEAVPKFLQKAVEKGLQLEKSKIVLAGGGQIACQNDAFNLGKQNAQAVMEILDHYGLQPTFKSLGGSINRSMSLEIKTGAVRITAAGKEIAAL